MVFPLNGVGAGNLDEISIVLCSPHQLKFSPLNVCQARSWKWIFHLDLRVTMSNKNSKLFPKAQEFCWFFLSPADAFIHDSTQRKIRLKITIRAVKTLFFYINKSNFFREIIWKHLKHRHEMLCRIFLRNVSRICVCCERQAANPKTLFNFSLEFSYQKWIEDQNEVFVRFFGGCGVFCELQWRLIYGLLKCDVILQ